MARQVAVAVPVPFLPVLTYRVPDEIGTPAVGSRVVVPLAHRTIVGCVVEKNTSRYSRAAKSEKSKSVKFGEVRDLLEVLDEEAYLPLSILELTSWVAEYFACGVGEVIAAAMPPLAMSGRGRRSASAFKFVKVAELSDRGRDMCLGTGPRELGARQRLTLHRLQQASDGLPLSTLRSDGVGNDTINRLRQRGLVTVRSVKVERAPFGRQSVMPSGQIAPESDRVLTEQQRQATERLTQLSAKKAFQVALLHGVTGSGKTEVYLRLARYTESVGRTGLMLVPEIALTPAMVETFHGVFGRGVAIQHSGLSDGERHDQWHRIRRGEVHIVIGTRSAVFAPLENLGLIIVDEEHDGSYKQEETPRYHARSVAIVRAQQAGALVVLGSATPSLESYDNTRTGRYQLVVMDERVQQRSLPDVTVVDMRQETAVMGTEVVLSRALRLALESTAERGTQALVLLNRRGYATAMLCRQCGQALECPNCSVALTLHHSINRARCHHCDYSEAKRETCSHCAGPYLESLGFGTERVESEIAEILPGVSVGRLDRDTVRRRGSGASLLTQFREGKIQVLVGTQMIAKGHDFPKVTLVGVVSADMGLTVADFRASERTFQLLTQVAGRAGRGDLKGQAIIQSYYPDHYSIGYACQQAYEPFFEEELRFRKALRYPPTLSLVNVIVRGRSFNEAMSDAKNLARSLRSFGGFFELMGPAAAPISKIRGQHRVQLFLKGANRRAMREAVRLTLDDRPKLRRKVTVDIDPFSML